MLTPWKVNMKMIIVTILLTVFKEFSISYYNLFHIYTNAYLSVPTITDLHVVHLYN